MIHKKIYVCPKTGVQGVAALGTILWASWDKPEPGAPARRTGEIPCDTI